MVRIAIVEDDRHDREALKKCLSRYEKENQVKFSLTEFREHGKGAVQGEGS